MRYPKFLKKNDTIGFVSPSFAPTIEPYITGFKKAVETFEELGYKTKEGPNCTASCGIGISNTPELCARELTDMYCEGDTKVLISCGGGELMCRILPHMDFDRIRTAEPKWFMGYSDNTNFTFLLNTLCDVASIYGPNAPSFGAFVDGKWQDEERCAFEVLTGKKKDVRGYFTWEKEDLPFDGVNYPPYNATEPRILKSNRTHAEFSGRLLGGCLDCLENLVGTRYDKVDEFVEKYREDGIIWFLEACDKNPMEVCRALWHFREAGWFKYAKGFLIGRPLGFGEEIMGLDHRSAVLEVLSDLDLPIIMDLDIGHLPPKMPIISGAFADVTFVEQDFYMRYTLK